MPLDDKGELPVLDDGGRQYALALALLAHVIAGGKQPDDGNDQSSGIAFLVRAGLDIWPSETGRHVMHETAQCSRRVGIIPSIRAVIRRGPHLRALNLSSIFNWFRISQCPSFEFGAMPFPTPWTWP